jgi:hypothetical protein
MSKLCKSKDIYVSISSISVYKTHVRAKIKVIRTLVQPLDFMMTIAIAGLLGVAAVMKYILKVRLRICPVQYPMLEPIILR